jgi:hypothetical protein
MQLWYPTFQLHFSIVQLASKGSRLFSNFAQ